MSSSNIYPNSVNGIPCSSVGDVALGRSSTGQVEIGRDHISGPVDGGTPMASTAHSLARHEERGDFITCRAPPAYPLLEPIPLTSTRPKWHTLFDKPAPFVRYFVIRSSGDSNLCRLNVFKVTREISSSIGGEPKKLSHNSDGTLNVEVSSAAQGEKLASLTALLGESITVEPHKSYNESQGVIVSSILQSYSESDILDGLSDQGVTRVYRLKKRVDGHLTPTAALVLSFQSHDLPERVKIMPGYFEKVRLYIPMPRRCFRCQSFGHVGGKCRSPVAFCVTCGLEAHDDGPCRRSPTCCNCDEPHPASSKSCSRFLLEKEILAIKTKERLTFPEARQRALSQFIRPGVTFASIVRPPTRGAQRQPTRNTPHDSPALPTDCQPDLPPPLRHGDHSLNDATDSPVSSSLESPESESALRDLASTSESPLHRSSGKRREAPTSPCSDSTDIKRSRNPKNTPLLSSTGCGFVAQTGDEDLVRTYGTRDSSLIYVPLANALPSWSVSHQPPPKNKHDSFVPSSKTGSAKSGTKPDIETRSSLASTSSSQRKKHTSSKDKPVSKMVGGKTKASRAQ